MSTDQTASEADPGHVLTWRQRKVLQAIAESVRERGYPPSMPEIGKAVGLTSASSVSHHLRTLERKGYLHREPGRPRALEVRIPGQQRRPDAAAERERAEAAEATLAAIRTACRAHLEREGACCPHFAQDVLEIISGEEDDHG